MSRLPLRDSEGARLGMWLFLFTELLLFGGLFLLYAVYLHRYPAAFAAAGGEMHLKLATANTLILISSSLLVALSFTALQRSERLRALLLLCGTIGCGLVFLLIKYLEWQAEISKGIYPGSPLLVTGPPGNSVFYSLYFLTTGLHGLHVLIGVSLLSVVALKIKQGAVHAGNAGLLEISALYWHLIDLIWIFIFPLYYLIL